MGQAGLSKVQFRLNVRPLGRLVHQRCFRFTKRTCSASTVTSARRLMVTLSPSMRVTWPVNSMCCPITAFEVESTTECGIA